MTRRTTLTLTAVAVAILTGCDPEPGHSTGTTPVRKPAATMAGWVALGGSAAEGTPFDSGYMDQHLVTVTCVRTRDFPTRASLENATPAELDKATRRVVVPDVPLSGHVFIGNPCPAGQWR